MAQRGRPPGGKKYGGRQKGTKNKINSVPAEIKTLIARSPLNAVGLLVQIYQDEARPIELRMEAAKSAAPYETPRLSAAVQTIQGPDGKPIAPVLNIYGPRSASKAK